MFMIIKLFFRITWLAILLLGIAVRIGFSLLKLIAGSLVKVAKLNKGSSYKVKYYG